MITFTYDNPTEANIEAVKELKAEIQELKAEVAALRGIK
jgi:ribosomal protein L29